MQEWSARIQLGVDHALDVTERMLDDLLELLAERGASLSVSDDRYGATMTAFGPDPVEAADEALDAFTSMAEKAGLPPGRVVELSVTTYEEVDRRLAQSPIPELVGVSEVAAILGVSKTRVGQLARTLDAFPPPVVRLAATPVWLASAVRAFARTWHRRPGRPAAM